ncbi:hypothetical protein FUA23_00090 [Neolewinella aurantiaca]|uniref:Caspase domain-containing protein n=2 Tax=Neolewinella aurantiaca TaxID=2602767 RepID=A0A5C7FJX5_9BACT|nr:hypothetical protein FUA23_00090 [Neolewinella aurantiaca]
MLDDNSPTYLIREGSRSIDYGVQREVDRMQKALGISDVHYYRLNGHNFNREALDFVVDYQLAYQERDIIIFVYTGHGFRDAGSSGQLPKLYFGGYENAMEGDELRFRLLEKNPSLLINLVIACNSTQVDQRVAPGRPEDSAPSSGRLASVPTGDRPYHVLFSDQPGYTKVIDLVSADREYETFLSRDGGIFFSEVLYALQEVFADQRLTSWPGICSYIQEQTLLRTQERGLRQKPYCAYNVFKAMDNEVPTIIVAGGGDAISCRLARKNLRRDQRAELKALRRRHRQEIRSLRGRDVRRLANMRQRQEVGKMKYVHLQAYQRKSDACK